MKLGSLKYFSTLLFFAAALCASWWLWNYYMHSPWTRDGKIRVEIVGIAPQVGGRITALHVSDNQFVRRGAPLLTLDDTPYQIARDNAQSLLAKAQADNIKAQHEAARRQRLPGSAISAEDLDIANLTMRSSAAAVKSAAAQLAQAQWQLSQTQLAAPADGWITRLTSRVGDYAASGTPLFALVDSHSFYVVGYFEETKLRHIHAGDKATLRLYSDDRLLTGQVESIGRAIYDQSEESSSSLVPDVEPTVPWVRLAQRVPVRIRLTAVPADVTLVAGTTCSIAIGD